MRRLLRRPSHATIVAYLALFFALGGSAMAAFVVSSNSQIAPNTIYGANKPAGANDNIVDGSITALDIKPSSLGSGRILDGSLTGADLAANTVTGGNVADESLTSADLATDSVQATEIADNSIDSGEIVNNSLTTADLAGTDVSGAVNFSGVPNGRCVQSVLNVSGAQTGQVAVINTKGDMQAGMVLYAQRVPSAGHVEAAVCNFTGGAMTPISNLPVRVITFG